MGTEGILVAGIRNSLGQLEELYNEIGYSSQEKEMSVNSIAQYVRSHLNEQIQILKDEKDQYKREVIHFQDEIAHYLLLLNEKENMKGDERISQGKINWKQHASRLKAKLNDIQKKHEERIGVLKSLTQEYHDLLTTLMIEDFREYSIDFEGAEAALERIAILENQIKKLNAIKKQRLQTFHQCRNSILKLWAEMGLKAQSDMERQLLNLKNEECNDFILSEENLETLKAKVAVLEKEREERKAHILSLTQKIRDLWFKLDIENSYQEEFLQEYQGGYDKEVLDAFELELSRMMLLKKQSMEKLIAKAGQEIKRLLNELYMQEEEQERSFLVLSERNNSEENLIAHENEICRLKGLLLEWEPILHLVNKHRDLLDKWQEFEEMTRDSERLFKREPGRLLKEEKFRNMVNKELPALESKLKDALIRWEKEQKSIFKYFGKRYLDFIEEENRKRQEEKDREKALREQRRAPKADNTPVRTPSASFMTSISKQNFQTPIRKDAGIVTPSSVIASARMTDIKLMTPLATKSKEPITPMSGIKHPSLIRKENMTPLTNVLPKNNLENIQTPENKARQPFSNIANAILAQDEELLHR